MDEVRFLVGDTDTSDQQVSDEEIWYAVSANVTAIAAAAKIARAIANKYARLVTSSVGSVSESASDLWNHYREMADEFDQQSGSLVTPSFGGITVAEHTTDRANANNVQPFAVRDQFNNPNADDPDVT